MNFIFFSTGKSETTGGQTAVVFVEDGMDIANDM